MPGTQKTRRTLLVTCVAAAGFLTIAGCKAKDAPQDGVTTAAASHVTSGASNAQVNADAAVLASYPLTSENVAKVTKVMQTIHALEKSDPALKAQWDNYAPKDPKSIDDAIAQMEKAPRAPEILSSAGISAHDFMYTTFALMYASVGYEIKKAGRPLPAGTVADHINPANIDFVATHQAAIKAISDINSDDSSDDNS